jgi:hypothetical protein
MFLTDNPNINYITIATTNTTNNSKSNKQASENLIRGIDASQSSLLKGSQKN